MRTGTCQVNLYCWRTEQIIWPLLSDTMQIWPAMVVPARNKLCFLMPWPHLAAKLQGTHLPPSHQISRAKALHSNRRTILCQPSEACSALAYLEKEAEETLEGSVRFHGERSVPKSRGALRMEIQERTLSGQPLGEGSASWVEFHVHLSKK